MAKIVIADVDETTVASLTQVLGKSGHEVVTADDAYTAASVAHAHQAALVVVYHQIPSGGSLKAIEWMRAKSGTRKTPIIVLFAASAPPVGVAEDALIRLLEKPVDLGKFRELLDEFVEPSGPSSGPSDEGDFGRSLPPLGHRPPPPLPMDMGAPSDDDLPPGETISLDL